MFKSFAYKKADSLIVYNKEQLKKLRLLSVNTVKSMMNNLELHYSDEYSNKLLEQNGIKKTVESISLLKKWERDGVIDNYENRKEAVEAKEQLKKLERIQSFDKEIMNDDEKNSFEALIKDLDVDGVNNLLTDVNIRISREERDADNVIDFNREVIKKREVNKKINNNVSFNR